MQNPVMHIEMADGGRIDVELYPETAPNTVRSIIWLVRQDFYNGRDFYRVVRDFVLQTDCDRRLGLFESGCDYIIDGEYAESGYLVPQPRFEKYVVGMAGAGRDSNISSGSSFFILTGAYAGLDGNFAVVGRVIGGFDVVDRINEAPCNQKLYREKIDFHTPIAPQRMARLWVDTFGEPYDPPRTKQPTADYLAKERELDELIDFYRD